MISNDQNNVDFLYTNIGRGHPHYLDGIVECLPAERLGRVRDVFAATSGVASWGWRAVRTAYRLGGRGGAVSWLYNRKRGGTDYSRRGLMPKVLGRGLAERLTTEVNPLVVAHPLLAALLEGRQNLIYQHGEVVAPRESWVMGAHRVLVPLQKTADSFVAAGLASVRIFVSGLCVEPRLVMQAGDALTARQRRLSESDPPCGAFFSSGAEPRSHIETILAAALSAVRSGGRVIVFVSSPGVLERQIRRTFARAGIDLAIVSNPAELTSRIPEVLVCSFDSRRSLNDLTAALFSEFDYIVAPSHERTNWALGLGLPMFIADPPLGSYAPLNRQLLLDAGVAKAVRNRQEGEGFGATLRDLRARGELLRMVEAGWTGLDIRGFANIAKMLEGECGGGAEGRGKGEGES